MPAEWRATAFEQLADEGLDGVWACDRELPLSLLERGHGAALGAAGRAGARATASPRFWLRIGGQDETPALRAVLAGTTGVSSEQRAATRAAARALRTHYLPIRI